jgi:hypothetical protein
VTGIIYLYLRDTVESRGTDSTKTYEAPPGERNLMVRGRLRTLLELAIAIGTREGLLGNTGNFKIEGGENVTDKGSQ